MGGAPGGAAGLRLLVSTAFLFAGILVVQEASAQAELRPPGATSGVFRVSSNLVMVPVSVTGPEGELIRYLSIKDFELEEEEKSQPIARVAEPGRSALDLSLVLDVSGSMSGRFGFALEAASAFVRSVIHDGDHVSITSIGEEPRRALARATSPDQALSALSSLLPERGPTAFYDAVVMAAQFPERPSADDARRVQIVLSDGQENNSSNAGLTEALEALQHADCVFYAINPIGANADLNRISLEGQRVLQALAAQTGGMAFIPQRTEELPAIFDRIVAELQAQYLLEYYSTVAQADGRFRRIRVSIPGRPDLRIRARQGYYSRRS